MGDTARDAARAEMARAVEANLYAFGEEFERLQGVETYRGEDMQWCLTDEPFPLFNAVFDIHLTPESADRTIAAVLARARERGVSLQWYTGPSSTPADLGERLEAAGLQPGGTSPGMALELEDLREPPPLPRDVSIERVTDERTLRRWCRGAMEGFQMPDAVETTLLELSSATALAPDPSMHHYLGLHEGRPVACSTLFSGAGSAGIYNAGERDGGAAVPGDGLRRRVHPANLRMGGRNRRRVLKEASVAEDEPDHRGQIRILRKRLRSIREA
ncbi:MAG: hypothetical protein P8Y02_03390 [Deinococcales bacterium]